ncbi:ORF-120 [Teiidae poxvirus 1]|nr:ORF-120 [Teiidae poxvirus 1]
MRVCSVDLGIKNPAYSVFEFDSKNISLVSLEKLNWSKDWEKNVIKDITKHNPDIVVLEKQGPKSPTSKIIYFVKGFFFSTDTKVIVRNPPFRGISHRDRKKQSVTVFLEKISEYPDIKNSIINKYTKLDDLADSFNLGLSYLESLLKSVK